MSADGNCMFHAIAKGGQLAMAAAGVPSHDLGERAQQLRARLVVELLKDEVRMDHAGKLGGITWEQHVAPMAQNGEWG